MKKKENQLNKKIEKIRKTIDSIKPFQEFIDKKLGRKKL